jgi:hypothetical protein
MIKTLFLTICLVALSTVAYAQSDSVTTGVRVVEEFYTELTTMVNGTVGDYDAEAFNMESVDRANDAASRIRAMRWLETPGARRYNRVRRVVDSYVDSEIALVSEVTGNDEMTARLAELKIKKLKILAESLAFETYAPEKRELVPGIDPVPHEENREQGQGIFFR